MIRSHRARLTLTGLFVALSLVLAACGGSDDATDTATDADGTAASTPAAKLSGTIRIDGSSTVGPLSEAAAELFRASQSGVQITVGTSGTGGGFKKFCAGETDISDASRAISEEEKALCAGKAITYDQFQVANDGIALVVNKDNTWADCLTVAQLKKIWDMGSKVSNWKDVDPKFPSESLKLFGAGTDSGTFDFFTKAVNGKEKQSRTDYNATEDDNVTVQGVSGTKGGLGYFGLSYFEQNKDKLKVVKVDGGAGCIEPSIAAVQNATYKPLSRPLFIYPSVKALARPEVLAFVEYYIANTKAITEQALFVPLTAEQEAKLATQLTGLKAKG
jgi:phosphate transport system substrate-binding protein